jgi:hypothetical protein
MQDGSSSEFSCKNGQCLTFNAQTTTNPPGWPTPGSATYRNGQSGGLLGGIGHAWLTATAPIDRIANWFGNHPFLSLGLTAGMSASSWEQAEPAAEEELESLESSAASRASQLADALGKTKDYVTTAVTETEEGIRVISSSENALRPAQRALLQAGEVAAKGAGHAEVTGVNAAKQVGLTPTGVAASRPICADCAGFLKSLGLDALSPLK